MAWTATLVSKTTDNSGVVTAVIDFTDGTNTVRKEFRNAAPSSNWLPHIARAVIDQLTSGFGFNPVPGPITPETPDTPRDPNFQLYKDRLAALTAAKVLIDLGELQKTNAKVQALITWLKNNFDTYFG